MEDIKEKILQFMRGKGPVIPADIAKHINSNTLMASAHLSELSSNGRLKISKVKVGSTPLYYLSGQESQLQNFADNLHEKEKKAYDLLSQNKILKDNDLEPVIRVALRAIKDYAVPLQVNFKGNSEIFWKWYLLTNKEAEEIILAAIKKTEPTIKKPIPKKEIEEKRPIQKEISPETNKTKPIEKNIEKENKREIQKRIQPIQEKPEEKKKPIKIDPSIFLDSISNYFNKNNITTLSKEIIRKTEIDFIVQVPSAVGNLEYYCKAKNKKRINDADLASAFAQGQLRKLPVLILTNGQLTKRAKEMLQKDFKGMGIKQI